MTSLPEYRSLAARLGAAAAQNEMNVDQLCEQLAAMTEQARQEAAHAARLHEENRRLRESLDSACALLESTNDIRMSLGSSPNKMVIRKVEEFRAALAAKETET